MELEVCKGNFDVLGVEHKGSLTTFSVQNNLSKEPCSLILYPKGGKGAHGMPQEIPMEENPSGGMVWCVAIRNLDLENYEYNFKLGKEIVSDPYAKRILGREHWGEIKTIRSGFYNNKFNWGEDRLPNIPKEDMVIYKLHARGFSMDMPRIDGKEKGTIAAIERKLTYLKAMGVTTLDFMPLYEFEEMDEDAGQINYWGYTKGNYFAPKAAYLGGVSNPDRLKSFIKKLHANKMEIIMEFHFDADANSNFILEVLLYWAKEYHVDGFRLFTGQGVADLAAQDVYLGGRKLFCEYIPEDFCQKGAHAMKLFTINDWFAYSARKMLNKQSVDMVEFAGMMRRQRDEMGYVNFVADNNGFTLYDLFSYSQKRNLANGNDNLDGNDWNFSNNCGHEGITKDKAVLACRYRQIKNALAIVYLAQGVPLIWMGDENGNSQAGNNNAYCQDNEIGWKSWSMKKSNKEVYEFVEGMAKIRKEHPILRMPSPMQLSDYKRLSCPDLSYHGERAWLSSLEPSGLSVGIMYCGAYANNGEYVYLGFNFSDRELALALPDLPGGGGWHRIMDTSKEAGEIFTKEELGASLRQTVTLESHSICVLVGKVPKQSSVFDAKDSKGSSKKRRKTSLRNVT